MTTDLTKTFFDTFGIEPEIRHSCNGFWEKGIEDCPVKKCDICKYKHETIEYYPIITDRILLELIRLGLNYDFVIHSKSVEELKEKLLALLIYNEAEFKQQVQELFKER